MARLALRLADCHHRCHTVPSLNRRTASLLNTCLGC